MIRCDLNKISKFDVYKSTVVCKSGRNLVTASYGVSVATKPQVEINDKIQLDTINILGKGGIQENYSKLPILDRSQVVKLFSIGQGWVMILYVIRWTFQTHYCFTFRLHTFSSLFFVCFFVCLFKVKINGLSSLEDPSTF